MGFSKSYQTMNCNLISRNYLKVINKMLLLIKVKDVVSDTAHKREKERKN